jgi:hypothetical protein
MSLGLSVHFHVHLDLEPAMRVFLGLKRITLIG